MTTRKGRINLLLPFDWRQGQSIVNFERWLGGKDIDDWSLFYMEDDRFESLWLEYMDWLSS